MHFTVTLKVPLSLCYHNSGANVIEIFLIIIQHMFVVANLSVCLSGTIKLGLILTFFFSSWT